MKKIIVPIDFSETAYNAFLYAVKLGERLGSSIELIHVYTGTFSPEHPIVMHSQKGHDEAINQEIIDFIDEAKKDFGGALPVEVTGKTVLGFPEVEIVKLSKQEDTRLIVMSTSGSHGVSGKIFGTVSTHIARKSSCPVFLIPKDSKEYSIDKILYASNFESATEENILNLIEIASLFDASVYFVHVDEENHNYDHIENNIHEIIFKNADANFSYKMVTISDSSFTEGVTTYAKENDIDLIVMVSPKKSFLANIFHISATKTLAFYSELPMLVYH